MIINYPERTFPTKSILILGLSLLLFYCCSSQKPDQIKNKELISLTDEQDSTQFYHYKISYPDSVTEPILAEALKRFAQKNKRGFLKHLPQDSLQYHVTPWELLVQIEPEFESGQFRSYKALSYHFTGGAHGISSIKTFTLDKEKNHLIEFADLFSDTTAALKSISDFAMDKIASQVYEKENLEKMERSSREWVMEGAAPQTTCYRLFSPAQPKNHKATGLTIYFSDYQVGPHSIGMPEVFIPDSVFHDFLMPGYNSAFIH